MVDDNKALRFGLCVNSLITDEVLKLYDFLQLRVGEFPLGFYEFLSLFCGRIEEARVDLAEICSSELYE